MYIDGYIYCDKSEHCSVQSKWHRIKINEEFLLRGDDKRFTRYGISCMEDVTCCGRIVGQKWKMLKSLMLLLKSEEKLRYEIARLKTDLSCRRCAGGGGADFKAAW